MTKVFALLAEYQHQIAINLPPFQQQHIWFLYSSFLHDSYCFFNSRKLLLSPILPILL